MKLRFLSALLLLGFLQSIFGAGGFKETLEKAKKGDAQAQSDLGEMYGRGEGVKRDPVEAVNWFRKAAEQGHAHAQWYLGVMYYGGEGVGQDLKEAVRWARKAAEQGVGDAQGFIGALYDGGEGVQKDPVEAVRWYRKAAEQGNAMAQYSLAVMYYNGEGIEKNLVEAMKWYRKAAEQGNAEAQYYLGLMYVSEEAVEKNPVEAVKWYRKAAEQGNAMAQSRLGWMYYNGWGVVKDELESLAWWYVAQANGEDVNTRISAMESSNGKAFALQAQKRAKEIQDEIQQTKSADHSENNRDFNPGNRGAKTTGTGVIITADGLILTAAHVVEGGSVIKVRTGSGQFTAALLSVDRKNDVALLKADLQGVPVPVKTSKSVKLGQKVFTLGFPNVELQGSNLKMTEGSISSLGGIQDDPRQWQISVPVQPGNSGGPLFDEQGNVVGVVVSKLDAIKTAKYTGDLPQNVNYAVKSAYFLPLLEPYESKLVSENRPKLFSKPEGVVKKVQDSVVLILVY